MQKAKIFPLSALHGFFSKDNNETFRVDAKTNISWNRFSLGHAHHIPQFYYEFVIIVILCVQYAHTYAYCILPSSLLFFTHLR